MGIFSFHSLTKEFIWDYFQVFLDRLSQSLDLKEVEIQPFMCGSVVEKVLE